MFKAIFHQILRVFDLKTFFLTLGMSALWIIFSDHLVHKGLYDHFDIQTIQTFKGLFYVTLLSFLLAYFHKREKNILTKQEQDYSRLFSDSPQILLIFRMSDYKILDVNQKAMEHYGYNKDEFLALDVLDIRPERDRKKIAHALDSGELSNTNHATEWVHQKRDGTQFPVQVYGRDITFQNERCRHVTILDITDLKAAEELSVINAKLITLGEVSANIGHEIRNPLSIMDLTVNKLEDKLAKHGFADLFKTDLHLLSSSISRVNDTVVSLQRLSKRESTEDFESVVASLLIKESTILIKHKFQAHNIKLEFGFLPDTKLKCHPGQMTQVLLNILMNASDALNESDQSDKKVYIESNVESDTLKILIKNNGVALKEDLHQYIFAPFFTTKNKGKGTGLGLSISQKIIKAHEGTISCDVEDSWTRFDISLPLNGPKEL